MSLPVPMLDDRRFQDIVDQAKLLIPRYCPEWTDHNVSDPGVTLIELFAWMTDLLLYRVNQVPDKMYVSFLEMLGVRLEPPRPAHVPLTVYLSGPQPSDVTIPAGTEAASVRTETREAVVFTTETDLVIRTPTVLGAFTRSMRPGDANAWTVHALTDLDLPDRSIALFPAKPEPGDAFYLALERDHSRHVLALSMGCDVAGGEGVDPRNPPLAWEAWQGGAARWVRCELEYDGTGGFNYSDGEVILHLPEMAPETLQGVRAHWIRCRLTPEQAGYGGYRVSPRLLRLEVEARGGTVAARHALPVLNERLGLSDGTPGQQIKLLNTPVLDRDPARDFLVVTTRDGRVERWTEVAHFADSGPDDRHYCLDALDGTLTLGPSLLQPDGSVHSFGAVPPKDAELRFSRYTHGGGVVGNLRKGAITVLKSSIPYVSQVINRVDAAGGRDAQSLDDARLRVPQVLRTRERAVTADDYEYLAVQVPGVARARCLAPEAQPGAAGEPKPGQVQVVVLPRVGEGLERASPERLQVSAELRAAVHQYLAGRRPLGITVEVRPPAVVWVSVQVSLHLASSAGPAQEIQARAEEALSRYLNPWVGGPRGDGWPFGRALHNAELYSLLQRIPEVEFVDGLEVLIAEPGAPPRPAPPRLTVPPDGVICAKSHRVSIV